MVKDFQEFVRVVAARRLQYGAIPVELLSPAGVEVRDLYRQLDSDIYFADGAADLLAIVENAPQYDLKNDGARRECKAMLACLRRLAQNEKGVE